jgi:hypothetical protein
MIASPPTSQNWKQKPSFLTPNLQTQKIEEFLYVLEFIPTFHIKWFAREIKTN